MKYNNTIFRLFAPDGAETGVSAAGATDAPPQEGDNVREANLDDKSKQPKAESENTDGDLFEFGKDNEGNFTIKTENSVYKGKTKQEAAKAFFDGKLADEKYIRQLKTRDTLKLPEGIKDKALKDAGSDDDGEPDITIRSRDDIATEIAPKLIKQLGADAKKLNWTNQQWKDYGVDQNLDSWEIADERGKIKEVRQAIEDRVERIYAEETKRMAIAETIDEEHEAVLHAVADSGVDPKQFDYQAVLEEVVSDKNSYNKFGTLKSGRIVAAALRELRKVEKDQGKSAYQRKIEEDIAKGNKDKAKVPSGGSGSGSSYQTKAKAYDSLDDALDAAKKEHGLV